MSRPVDKVILSMWQREGLGAKVRRSIGSSELRNFDPFLMLDEFNAGLPAAFPDHPHRGMETVTFMLPWSKGGFEHEDHVGHKGQLLAGDLQWMTAGRGILHSEVPMSEVPSHGLQLWVNLPRANKMMPPRYQEKKWSEIPHAATAKGVDVAVLSGTSYNVSSPVNTMVPIDYLFVKLDPHAVFEQPCDPAWNALIYTLNGGVLLDDGQRTVGPHHTVTFAPAQGSSAVRVQAGDDPVHFCYLAGRRINEPVAQGGPFVMNTQAELQQAFADYHASRNGFEGAAEWESAIGKKVLN